MPTNMLCHACFSLNWYLIHLHVKRSLYFALSVLLALQVLQIPRKILWETGIPPPKTRKTRTQNGRRSRHFWCPFFEFWGVEFRFLIIFSEEFAKLSLITARDNTKFFKKLIFSGTVRGPSYVVPRIFLSLLACSKRSGTLQNSIFHFFFCN